MTVYTEIIKLKTKPKKFFDITEKVSKAVKNSEIGAGMCFIFSPASTASIILNEDEPMLMKDLEDALEKISSEEKLYHHSDNAHSHIRAMLLDCNKSVPVESKKLILGNWQHILFAEFDIKERDREVVITVMGD